MPTLYRNKDKQTDWPQRDADDHYPTEPAAVNFCVGILMSHLYLDSALGVGMGLADMGAGSGIWGHAWRDAVHIWMPYATPRLYGYEIRPLEISPHYDGWLERDIFDINWHYEPGKYHLDVAFGNPPYIPNWRAMYLTITMMIESFRYTAFLLKDSFLAGQARLNRLFFRNPPLAIWKAASRVSFSGDKASNADEYVFIVWKKGYTGETPYYWFNHRDSYVDTRFTDKVMAKVSRYGTAAEAARYPTVFNPDWGGQYLKGQQESAQGRISQSEDGESRSDNP